MVAELTEASNVHFHGYISFAQSHYKHHIIDILKRFPLGMSKINSCIITEKVRTVNYMFKDYLNTVRFINNPVIKYIRKIIPPIIDEVGAEGPGPSAPALARVADLDTVFIDLDIAEYTHVFN